MPIKLTDWLYLIGILAAVTWAFAFPTWIGQSYSIDSETNLVEYASGTFGLDGASVFEEIAPVWSPPKPVSPLINASLRMPWQPTVHQHHVEVSLSLTFFRLFLCSLVLGVLHRINIAFAKAKNSTIGSIAWSTSLMSILGCLIMYVLGAFTMGYALTDQIVLAIMVTLTMVGVVLGIMKTPTRLEAPTGVDPKEARTRGAGWNAISGWTILGIGIGFVLMLATGAAVFHFRQSVGPFTVDHTGNLIAGLAMILFAWATALVLWKSVPASLRNGFLFAANILGVLCIFQF